MRDIQTEMLKGLRDNYEQVRAPIAREGMDKTLQNLKRIAERYRSGLVFEPKARN